MVNININIVVNINANINIDIYQPNPFTGRRFSSFPYSTFCDFPLQIMRYDISLRHKKKRSPTAIGCALRKHKLLSLL